MSPQKSEEENIGLMSLPTILIYYQELKIFKLAHNTPFRKLPENKAEFSEVGN